MAESLTYKAGYSISTLYTHQDNAVTELLKGHLQDPSAANR